MASSMFNLSGALSDPKAFPVNYWDEGQNYLNNVARQWRKTFSNQNNLFNMAQEGILGNTDAAKQNAQVYNDYIKNLFATPQTASFGNYSQLGDYLYGKLNDYTNVLKDAGLRDMNARLAAQGITPGSSGYDRLLNATRITSNTLPAFINTTNAINTGYNTLANDQYRNMLTRLGLAQSDALTQNLDRPYTRYLDLADEQQRQQMGRAAMLQQLMNAAKTNNAGFQIKETSDAAKAIGVVDNLLNGAVDIYGSMYGGGMGGGGGGIGGYNSPALSSNGFNLGQAAQLGNAAGNTGGNNNLSGIIQLLMGLLNNRQQPATTGGIPGRSTYGGYDNEAGLAMA